MSECETTPDTPPPTPPWLAALLLLWLALLAALTTWGVGAVLLRLAGEHRMF